MSCSAKLAAYEEHELNICPLDAEGWMPMLNHALAITDASLELLLTAVVFTMTPGARCSKRKSHIDRARSITCS